MHVKAVAYVLDHPVHVYGQFKYYSDKSIYTVRLQSTFIRRTSCRSHAQIASSEVDTIAMHCSTLPR